MTRIIRLAVYLVLGLLLGATATFASAASTFGNASSKGMKSGAWNGSGSIDSGRTAKTIESVNIGGKYIPVPMLGSVGAAALEALIIGLKNSPQAIVVGGVVSYLASKGMQMVDGSLKVAAPPVPAQQTDPLTGNYEYSCGGNVYVGPLSIAGAQQCASAAGWGDTAGTFVANSTSFNYVGTSSLFSGTYTLAVMSRGGTCQTGYHLSGSTCVPDNPCPSGYVLAVDGNSCLSTAYDGPYESDWDKIRNDPPLPEVMKEICQKLSAIGSSSYACPVTNQRTEPVTEPLTDWKTDPVTGQQNRQVAKISPAPTPENPERVEITTETETKTTTTNPETGQPESSTETKKDENSDFCVLHPDSLACAKIGDLPEDPALDPTNKDVTITRQDWGAADASCPNDLSYTLRLTGHTVGMSYKPVCDGLRTFRPVVIGMGWLAAIFAFLGISRRAQG